MKTYLKLFLLASIIAGVNITSSFAALNAYLTIKGNDVSKKVKLTCADGTCTAAVDELPAGKYTITLCDANGQPLALKVKEKGNRTKCSASFRYEIKSPRDVASGQSSGKRTVEEQESSSPSTRESSTGQSTGKRQHKPIMVTKTVDKATPKLMTVVDLDRDGMLDISLKLTWNDGAIVVMDDWETPVSTH